MDGAFITLTEIEQENLLRAIETSLQVKRRHQFFLWTQGPLQPFVPHRILICNVMHDGTERIAVDCFNSCVVSKEVFNKVCDPVDGLLMQTMAAWRAAGDIPLLIAPEVKMPISCYERFRSQLEEIDFNYAAGHGCAPVDGRSLTSSYFLFAGMPETLTIRNAYFLELLMPHIHAAFLRSLAQKETPALNADPPLPVSALQKMMTGREIDIRVSIMPSIWGEDAVLRVLDKQALTDHLQGLRLDAMGFDDDILTRLRRLSNEPYGMVLVTGPTGSGKTTTLYAALSEINRGEDKIITIEDPVEYQLSGVLQIPVNEKKGLTFARGLRSILRHDPDKIMVGEIRDAETAQIAVQSALTGHLVFTTVHANNVFDVIGRFLHMDVDPYNLVSALNGVVAQRLIRTLCAACAESTRPTDEELRHADIDPLTSAQWNFRRAVGCGACRGTGYRGRRAIAEMMVLNDEIRELIISRAPIRQLKEAARQSGTRSLRESALDHVREGRTSLEEANRVTFVA